jgi:putative transposase
MDIRRGATIEVRIYGVENCERLATFPQMANTFTSLHYHLVFSTKKREPWIRQNIEDRVWKFLGGIARENGIKPIKIGGMPDHIHMAVGLPATMAISEAAKLIKGGSSAWIKETFPGTRGFAWQDGYGGFTVSKSNLEEVVCYIETQREHHRIKTFQEEYRAFLDRHEIAYKEKYLWD